MAQIILPTHLGNTSFSYYPVCVSVTVFVFGTPLLPQEPCACRLSSQPPSSPKQPLIYFLTEFPGLDVWCDPTPPHNALQDVFVVGSKASFLWGLQSPFFGMPCFPTLVFIWLLGFLALCS